MIILIAVTFTSCIKSTAYYGRYVRERYPETGVYMYYDLEMSSGKYQLTYSDDYDHLSDVVMTKIISEGHYKHKGHKVYLYDDDFGFQMIFRRSKKNLIVEQSFPHFIGQKFIYEGRDFEWSRYAFDEYIEPKCETWQIPLISENNAVTFHEGKYNGDIVSIEFDKERSYRYYYCGQLFSEGTWTREGNFLTLQDTALHYTIEAAIADSAIITKAIPAIRDGNVRFKLVDEDSSR